MSSLEEQEISPESAWQVYSLNTKANELTTLNTTRKAKYNNTKKYPREASKENKSQGGDCVIAHDCRTHVKVKTPKPHRIKGL